VEFFFPADEDKAARGRGLHLKDHIFMDSIYRLEGMRAHTSKFAAGPWSRAMQHGSAPTSLIARMAEHKPTLAPMRVARITVDLIRPVPIETLDIETEIVREGRKIQLSNIRLLAGGTPVVRASVLKIRTAGQPLPPQAAPRKVDVPLPDDLADAGQSGDDPVPFLTGLSMRAAKGAFYTLGPAAIWYRANRAIIEGEPVSPLMRAAVAADFCNGASSVLPWDSWTFINADLTITLAREPVGEWVLLDAETWAGEEGRGIAFADLADTKGYFGRAVQNILLERRT
jgi:hypothetical protein